MSLFQIVFIIVVACLLSAGLVALFKGWASRREGVIWTLVCLAAGVAILWPQTTTRLARVLGIGRGTDLLLYCAVVVMMIGFLMVYARIRYLRREITLLVRQLALRDATVNPSSPENETHP